MASTSTPMPLLGGRFCPAAAFLAIAAYSMEEIFIKGTLFKSGEVK